MKIKHGKLPDAYIECFEKLNISSKAAGLEYMLIGATARDLVIENVYGIRSIRRTYDIDISICIDSWEKFEKFKNILSTINFSFDPKVAHKMNFTPSLTKNKLQLDLIPFGAISDANGQISWPPNFDVTMSVLGFSEAFKSKLLIDTNNDTVIPVASIEGFFLLKLIAWLDRDSTQRQKDAEDLGFVLENYEHLDGMTEKLFEEDCLESYDFDLTKTATSKLAREIREICTPQTYKHLLTNLLTDNKENILEQLATEISRYPEKNLALLTIFKTTFLSQDT